MNILIVLSDYPFPPDGRSEREARDYIREGHNLFLMARRKPGQLAKESVGGVHVIRVVIPFQRHKKIADLIYHVFQRYLIFFNIVWVCLRHHIDVLHVHDLPYAFATVLAGKVLRHPVIFDMRENYTVMLKTGIDAREYKLLKPFFYLQLALLRLEEKVACRWANKVIVVAQEHIPRIEGLGVLRENIMEVTNTEDIDHFSGLSIDESLVEKYQGDFVITYYGGFSAHRGLETAVEAMPLVLKEIPNAKLLLVGSGYNKHKIEQLALELNLADKVIFPGYQAFETMPSYINLSVAGLIPHISTPHIETTMPNKIFQFMMLGKPVIVSSVKPLMRVVNDAQCGLIFQERNPQSLAKAILQLRDEDLCRRLGENGKIAVQDRYNWQQTIQPLLELCREIALQKNVKTDEKKRAKSV